MEISKSGSLIGCSTKDRKTKTSTAATGAVHVNNMKVRSSSL